MRNAGTYHHAVESLGLLEEGQRGRHALGAHAHSAPGGEGGGAGEEGGEEEHGVHHV